MLSMIAYHNDRSFSPNDPAPTWFIVIAVAIIGGIVASIVAGLFAGEISSSGFLFLVVGFLVLTYILSRKITMFGLTFYVIQILMLDPGGSPAGESETRQRLADCEARIMKLKDGRA